MTLPIITKIEIVNNFMNIWKRTQVYLLAIFVFHGVSFKNNRRQSA